MHNLQNALDFPNFLLLQDSNMILLFLGLFVILEIQPLLGVQVLQEYNLHIILKEIQLCRILLMICEGQVFHLNWIYIFFFFFYHVSNICAKIGVECFHSENKGFYLHFISKFCPLSKPIQRYCPMLWWDSSSQRLKSYLNIFSIILGVNFLLFALL